MRRSASASRWTSVRRSGARRPRRHPTTTRRSSPTSPRSLGRGPTAGRPSSPGLGTHTRACGRSSRPTPSTSSGGKRSSEGLLDRLSNSGQASRFIAVVGPSGSGKSSAVRAGLVAAIRGGAVPGSDAWFVTEMHPGHHPLEELDAALMRVAVRPPADLLGRLESGPRGLLEVADAIVPDGTELLVIVDQFEETFTLTENEDDRALFLESLRVATADPTSRVRVIVTLRADFYDRPLRYPRMGELLGSSTEVLSPLTPEELERAIVRPAEHSGLQVDRGLVPQIAADVAEQAGALPLVQYALTELYDRRHDGRLTFEAYREIGGVGGALAASAEHLYATRRGAGREAVRQLFLRLVTLGEGTADTRRRVPLSRVLNDRGRRLDDGRRDRLLRSPSPPDVRSRPRHPGADRRDRARGVARCLGAAPGMDRRGPRGPPDGPPPRPRRLASGSGASRTRASS